MTLVKDAMTKDAATFSPDASVYDCAKILREKKISGAPVVDENGKVIGILSEADIIKIIESKDININLILPSPFDVLELPVRMKLGLDDVMKSAKKAASARARDAMTRKVFTVNQEDDISEATKIMAERNINRLPVMDENGKLVGIITRGDVIGAI
ncbi:CBS domain-containing protein [archaeon]|nr:CBS domain-containing protein [archaeon]